MDVEVSAQENISNLEDKIDCATNSESNESNAADVGTSLAPEGEDTRNSEEQEVVENEESIECVGKETVDVNDTGENSASKDSHEDESENTQDDENVKSQNVQNEESQDVDNEESQNVEKEASQNGETEESQNVQNDKSQNEETGDKEHEKNENSQEKETETIVNGDSEDIVHNDDRDSDKKMDIDENEDDDDDDFNPLLLCPDISMDVDESPVLTGSTDLSRGGDTSDPNSLFAPLFSTFVDEMTGAEISFNLTADEQQLREKLYGPNNPIQFTKIHCTACNVHLGSALAGQTNRFVHPLLKVLICKECYHFYTSGEFEKDEDGSELYCRWCGQGGQVLCCTMCEFVFCKKCIRINFGRKKLTQVRDSDEWKCFRCDISQLKALRAMCVEFFEYIRRETARAATYGDSDTVNKDLTSCCQAASKKRQAEPDKETEKEVVKRPKRRRNAEEDPDYNPYAQSEDRSDSPVPSTSGVKPAANTPKVTYQIKTPASRNEVSFPGQSPSTTVRIGNQVINVKSVGTPSQTPSPVVKNTAIRTPIVPAGIRVKPALTPRAAVQAGNIRPAGNVRPPINIRPASGTPTVGSVAHVRSTSKPPNLGTPVMKHEWFEKTVRAAARVNSNLSYTLTQLNKAQSSASSVEQLAVVHNKLQEILSSSINSLIQIRKNLRTEFIAGIKTIRFPPKPTVDPNDDDVIIINPEPRTTPNATRSNKGAMPVPALVTMKKPSTPVTPNRVNSNNSASNDTPTKGYLKVRSFSQLQTVSSECITIPDDDPPPPSKTTEPVIVDVDSPTKDPLDKDLKEDDGNKIDDVISVEDTNEESVGEDLKNDSSETLKESASKDLEEETSEDSGNVAGENVDSESTQSANDNETEENRAEEKDKESANDNETEENRPEEKDEEGANDNETEENRTEENDKESDSSKNDDRIQNGDKENNEQSKKRKTTDDEEIAASENNGSNTGDSQKCNGNITEGEVVVKTEPNEDSYNVKDQPTPKIRRMLSVKVNLKKTPIVENMVKQEPLENGDN